MKDEILAPVRVEDVEAIPRYNLIDTSGTPLYKNVEIQLANEIIQQGTPYNTASVLNDDVAQMYGLPEEATPNDVFKAIAEMVYQNYEDLAKKVAENSTKIDTLWDAVFTNITGNPFNIYFTSLSGITVTAGVYNTSQNRLEC